MDNKLKKELDAIIKIGEDNGELRTVTVQHLLNELDMYTDETYREVIEYIEKSKKSF
ncbi:MAG: hypothetical protein HFI88_07290 [Lachnospiraceae bacterium]|nr:hypothetical protein [Lachnospiraceae bacterium]